MDSNKVTVATLAASESFQNYCKKADSDSVAYWKQWIADMPHHRQVVEEARRLVLDLSLELSNEEIATEFRRFKSSIKVSENAKTTKLYPVKKTVGKGTSRKWLGLVASFLLLISLLGLWQFGSLDAKEEIQLTTNFGDTQRHILPDGSKVILNANSSLVYTPWGQQEEGVVKLKGEAFFEVKKKEDNQKFIVQTEKGEVKVLGTSFNVLQRAKTLEVALLEGAIALTIPTYPEINMEPGEMIQVDENKNFKLSPADVDAFSAWRFQRIVFREAPIAKVIQRLKNEFNWNVIVDNQNLLQRKITATIPRNDPKLLLQAVSEIYDLNIEQKDSTTYLIK